MKETWVPMVICFSLFQYLEFLCILATCPHFFRCGLQRCILSVWGRWLNIDGRNLVPVDMENLPLFVQGFLYIRAGAGFLPSTVFVHLDLFKCFRMCGNLATVIFFGHLATPTVQTTCGPGCFFHLVSMLINDTFPYPEKSRSNEQIMYCQHSM